MTVLQKGQTIDEAFHDSICSIQPTTFRTLNERQPERS
jgi:hypothetical protein